MPIRHLFVVLMAVVAVGACGSSSDNAQPPATSAVSATVAPLATTSTSTATSSPTTTSTTTTTTLPEPKRSMGPLTVAQFLDEWRHDLDVAMARSELGAAATLGELFEQAGPNDAPATALTTGGATVALEVGEGDRLASVAITPIAMPEERNGFVQGDMGDVVAALLYVLDPAASARFVADSLDEVANPPRGRGSNIPIGDQLIEVSDEAVTIHHAVEAPRTVSTDFTIVDVFGPPLLLADYIDDVGKVEEWTIELSGDCATPGGRCVLFIDSELEWITLIKNQVVSTVTDDGRFVDEQVRRNETRCGRTDGGPPFPVDWTVSIDLHVAADEITGSVRLTPVDDDMVVASWRCLSYGTEWEVGPTP